jgi:hypothetical protein
MQHNLDLEKRKEKLGSPPPPPPTPPIPGMMQFQPNISNFSGSPNLEEAAFGMLPYLNSPRRNMKGNNLGHQAHI